MRGRDISQIIRKVLTRPAYNPWATHAAAEELERQGKRQLAHAVRSEIAADTEQYAMDPMEIWIRVEESEPYSEDT